MRNHVQKRSIVIAGHKTSVSLEDEFWDVLKEAAARGGHTLSSMLQEIDEDRAEGVNLSSAVRLWVLDHARRTNSAP